MVKLNHVHLLQMAVCLALHATCTNKGTLVLAVHLHLHLKDQSHHLVQPFRHSWQNQTSRLQLLENTADLVAG